MGIRAIKRALRGEIVERLLAMPRDDRHRQQAALCDLLPNLPGFHEAQTVLLYVTAFPEEIDTWPWLRLALAEGKALVCPRVDRTSRRLRLFRVDDPEDDLVPGILSIPEPRAGRPEVAPAEIDWVLVPGLAFDARGHRLGRGAGHYDRLLPTLRPEVPRWALILEPQWVEAVPVEPHDQPLDGVASASRRFSAPRPSAAGRMP